MPGANKTREGRLSRRDFARGVALAAATAVVPLTARGDSESASASAAQESGVQAMPAAAEAQLQTILAKYGKRLSDEQRTDIKRLVVQAQKTGETLRSFPLDNSDEPAMIFDVYRRKL